MLKYRKKGVVRLILCVFLAAMILGGCARKDTVQSQGPSVSETSETKKKRRSPGSQYDTLWDRLFALYDLPPVENSDIDRELGWFARHPGYLERAQTRAEPFLYSIVRYIERQKIPGELALLPIVESAFQPNVVSPARAAGIWQFIPSTGRNYGLKSSRSYDGRRDVYASTKAAVKYLKKLHRDFGDWLLAVAAYNCGEGAVGRAVRRNAAAGLPTDFWSLDLPRETRAYVPKLLAVARLFADPDRYGINLREMPNKAIYKPVKVNSRLDLALAADVAGMSLDQLYALNPGFKGQYADIDGSYHLYIPAKKKAADFRREVNRLALERRALFPIPSEEAMDLEPSGTFDAFRREALERREKRPVGERRTAETPVLASPKPSRSRTYSVQRGETLHSVARKHSVTVSELAKWNDIPITTKVQAGQRLIVESSGNRQRATTSTRSRSTSSSGSRKGAIASRKGGGTPSVHRSSSRRSAGSGGSKSRVKTASVPAKSGKTETRSKATHKIRKR